MRSCTAPCQRQQGLARVARRFLQHPVKQAAQRRAHRGTGESQREQVAAADGKIVPLQRIAPLADAGADFVKTSTGFAPTGATIEHVALMKSILPDHVGIKASGGIKTLEQALALVQAGAQRLGTSSGVSIVTTTKNKD